jgi:hypothetical protein
MMHEIVGCLQEAVKECTNFTSLDGLIFRDDIGVEIVIESAAVSSPPCTIGQQCHVIVPVHAN